MTRPDARTFVLLTIELAIQPELSIGLEDPGQLLQGGSRGTRIHKRYATAACFQDRLLIQPDGFQWSGFFQ